MRRWTWVALTLAGLAVGCGTGRPYDLVVYTSLEGDAAAIAKEAFEARHDSVRVHVVTVGPDDFATDFRAARGMVDVVWEVPARLLVASAEEGSLASFRPSWAGMESGWNDDGGDRWFGTSRTPFVIAFNRENVRLLRAPRDWLDLFHFRWRGEIDVVDPERDATMGDFVAAVVAERARQEEDLSIAFDWLSRLDAAIGEYQPDVREVVRALRTGEALMAILPRSVVERERREGADWLHYRIAESGTPVSLRGSAMATDAPSPELASLFLEMIGEAELRAGLAAMTGWGAVPQAGQAPAPAPAWLTLTGDWQAWPPAPELLADGRDGWLAQWRSEVRGRGGERY